MARLRNPRLFSSVFGVAPEELRRVGLFDPILNTDTKLFVDPLLLAQSRNSVVRKRGVAEFENYFGDIITLLRSSNSHGDLPWRNADRLFTFREPRETCLGYGDSTTHGSAIGPALRAILLGTAKEIVDLGVEDPKLFALLALLEIGIGADRISDLTTHAIKPALAELNEATLKGWRVPTEAFVVRGKTYQLARNPFETSAPSPILLVPKDVLRQLPIAHDWSDVADAAARNQALREKVNRYIGNVWTIRTRREKQQARDAVLHDKRGIKALMDTLASADKKPYDPDLDFEGHYLWRAVLTELARRHPVAIAKPATQTLEELERIVRQIVDAFRDLIENKGLWKEMWHNSECRHEHAAQRLFFAVADVYCKANNLDVSPEADSGGGPVDFKFSSGYAARLLVEIKLSTGRVVHGYETQLETYKAAASTDRACYLVINVGGMGSKLDRIIRLKNSRVQRGDRAADIILVDARPQQSASKRQSARRR